MCRQQFSPHSQSIKSEVVEEEAEKIYRFWQNVKKLGESVRKIGYKTRRSDDRR